MVDHRVRVGAERRTRMRACLVECALLVFAEHGIDAAVVDKVIKTAGVSRGTFYNYFRKDDELFVAVASEVSDEILRIVNPVVLLESDPATRVASGIRHVLQLVIDNPLLAEFLDSGGQSALRYGALVNEVVPRDIQLGIDAGQFRVKNIQLALDLLLGPIHLAFHTILTKQVNSDYVKGLAKGILMSLGVPEAEAECCCIKPIYTLEIPIDSLVFRAQSRRRH